MVQPLRSSPPQPEPRGPDPNILIRAVLALPASLLGSAAVSGAKGLVQGWASVVTIEQVREQMAKGVSLFLAPPSINTFLVGVAHKAPWALDEVTFDRFIDWVSQSNPRLASQVLGDVKLMQWGMRTWQQGIEDIRKAAQQHGR